MVLRLTSSKYRNIQKDNMKKSPILRTRFDYIRLISLTLAFLISPLPAFSHSHSLQLVQGAGNTIVERIQVPPKFKRIEVERNSFAGYLREYPLKEAGRPLLLHNGNEKENQDAHACIFDMPVESFLQESSQSIVYLYANYLYSTKQEDIISFYLTNGQSCRWTDWLEDSKRKRNLRAEVAGSLKKWTQYEKVFSKPDKDLCFKKYLRNVFAHTSPLSIMEYESEYVEIKSIEIGDILFDLSNPGNICMVVDICQEAETGEKAYLLAKGSSPASEFYVIKNPKRVNDPWYHEEDFAMKVHTPEHVFPKDSWRKVLWKRF